MSTLEFRGKYLEFLNDDRAEIDLEGALASGKTIVALWKELEKLKRYRGIWILISRWVDDQVHKLLRPEFERLARIHGTKFAWNAKESYYEFENGSRAFAFGLQTTEIEPNRRFGKIRGLSVSRIYVDQAEQIPADFPLELRRRLRPNIDAKVRGEVFPTQLTFTPNPTQNHHWLAKDYPESNKEPSRKYYALSLLDNAHNLPDSLIKQALLDCPPSHPRFRSVILGRRPEIIDYEARMKKPYPPDSAGALFEQAKNEAIFARR